jgi:hypothetical protein
MGVVCVFGHRVLDERWWLAALRVCVGGYGTKCPTLNQKVHRLVCKYTNRGDIRPTTSTILRHGRARDQDVFVSAG